MIRRVLLAVAVFGNAFSAVPASAQLPAPDATACRNSPAQPFDSSERVCQGFTSTELIGVTTVSKTSAWAVGSIETRHATRPLVQHWDGSAWTSVPSPQGRRYTQLYDVDAASDTDVWVVGQSSSRRSERGLVEHWDGSTWRVVAVPGHPDALTSVSVLSTKDVWAVGGHEKGGHGLPLILHWNGNRWAEVASPAPKGINGALDTVVATTADDVWASGFRQIHTGGERGLLEHWDGRRWTIAATPNPGKWVDQLLATGAGWAVGAQYANKHQRTPAPLLEHVDESGRWQVVSPPPGARTGELLSVTATNPSDTWLVGFRTKPLLPTMIHWDGSRLAKIADPGEGDAAMIFDADASTPDDVWAVGWWFSEKHPFRQMALRQHWNGHRWINY